jgi:hypothetical protein
MNERIRELAEQANELDYATFDEYNHKIVQHYKFNKEKFAELIVRECIQAIQNESKDPMDELEYGLRVAEGAILDHFGVEE